MMLRRTLRLGDDRVATLWHGVCTVGMVIWQVIACEFATLEALPT